MKKTLLLMVISQLLINFSARAQNIVYNPGLEIVSANPTGYNQLNLATGWSNCNGNYVNQGLWGSPDLLSVNGSGVALLPCGYLTCTPPHSGNNVVGFITYNGFYANCREYVRTNLTSPMQVGQTYSVSFWATTGSSSQVKYVSNNIGVLFTVNPTIQSGVTRINRIPHWNMTTVLDTSGWKYYSFTFKADSAYNHITFGNYYDDPSTLLISKNNSNQPYTYNILDDISVALAPQAPQSSFSVSSSAVCAGGSVQFTDQTFNSPTAWNWQVTGPVTSAATSSSPLFSFPLPGSYTVSLVSSNAAGSSTPATQIITVFPNPVINIIASPSVVCPNGTTTLTATGASSYNWSSGQTSAQVITMPLTTTTIFSVTGTDPNGCSGTHSVSVQVIFCEATSIKDYEKVKEGFVVYPNPAKNSFTLSGNKSSDLVILNDLAQKVLAVSLCSDNNYQTTVTSLKPGVYFASDGRSWHKIVVID